MRLISRRKVDEFARAFEGPLGDLASIYRRGMQDALEVLSNATSTIAQRRYAKAHLRQINVILANMQDEASAWAVTNVDVAYRLGLDFAEEGIRPIRRAGINLGAPRYEVFAQIHTDAVVAISQELTRTSDFAIAQIGRRFDDVFRETGMQAVARGVVSGRTRVEVSKEIKERLTAEGRMCFEDRRGHKWSLDNYAEMVARTTTREAMTQGTINQLLQNNIQLAQVSAHNAADFCIYYESVIVYIGPEPNPTPYPPISAINGGSPFHPRCAHVMMPFVESLASADEKRAGAIAPDLLNRTPAELQRRFRYQFPDRARVEGLRIRTRSRQESGPAARRRQATRGSTQAEPSASAVRRTLSREERAIRSNSYETAVLVDQSGATLMRKRGGANSVSFTPEEVRTFEGNVLTHNHPSGRSLSDADVNIACRTHLSEIRAVGDTYRYSMTPPPGGWNAASWRDTIGPSHRRHEADVEREFWERIDRGQMTREKAAERHNHEVWSRVARETGVGYNRVRWRE